MTEELKLVKPNCKGKKLEKVIIEAASQGKITAYVKHKKTGAAIPIDSEYVKRMKNGESFDISEAERRHNRRYFKVDKLSKRWDMNPDDVVGILLEFEVSCFVKPNEVENDGIKMMVGCEDVCVFEEYVLAIEKKRRLKKANINSSYQGFNRN